MANSLSVICAEEPGADDQQRQHREDREMLVFSDRISTWFIETLITSAYGGPCGSEPGLVLADPVEHDDRVVERVAEDREEGDHRRRA